MLHLLYNPAVDIIKDVVARCPTLHEEYKPAFWYSNSWINVFVMMLKTWFEPVMKTKRETIICPDGGEISIDWADDNMTQQLGADAPVLGILHTITGGCRQNHGFMRYAASRGWRSCVLNRRGHSGMPLRVIPHFSIMGNVDDTALMVDRIREQFPHNFVALTGLSAGSGQVVSYIGLKGGSVRIDAAASISPAWDLKGAFQNLQQKNPLLDRFITRGVINHFLNPPQNKQALSTVPKDILRKASSARSITEFMIEAAPLSGCKDFDDFMKENNPMEHFHGNRVPCLVLNALDDFLCLRENIRTDVNNSAHYYILKLTEKGSHVAFNEGMFAQGNFMRRLTLDFFDTIRYIEKL